MAASDSDPVGWLRSLPAVRERCEALYALAEAGRAPHFTLHADRLDAVTDTVLGVMAEQYPQGAVPPHSRWRDLEAGVLPRVVASWAGTDPLEVARRKVDLAFVSVLLDAGAGPDWRYRDAAGHTHRLAEGLAAASVALFEAGTFSSDPAQPHRVDTAGLRRFTFDHFQNALQVAPQNPLVAPEHRWALLQGLATALEEGRWYAGDPPRPGNLVDHLDARATGGTVSLTALWPAIGEGLAGIWPGDRPTLAGQPLGDVWPHSALGTGQPGSELVPLHKLGQWLTYALLEPLAEAGLTVTDTHLLTGLAEFRNAGLFVDLGVLVPRDPALLTTVPPVDAEPIVEWRALAVALLDRVAVRMRARLGLDEAAFPMSRVLQAGTWHAGRRLGRERRPGGEPPIRAALEGTVM